MYELAWSLLLLGWLTAGFFFYIRNLFRSKFFGNLRPYPANPPFDFDKINTVWDDVYFKGRVRTKKRKGRRRRYLHIESGELRGEYSFALVIWRCMNPNYVIAPDEEVHHVDFDPLNDCYENLRLIPHAYHVLLHQRHEKLTRKPLGIPIFNNGLQEQLEKLKRAIQ